MRTHFAFHGGVHPPENKKQSTGLAIQIAPVPETLVIPLSQHIGAAAEPVVSVGDRVLKGQVIAEAVGRISVNVHASSSGVVEAIEPRPIPHTSGMEGLCIVIRTDGLDEWADHKGLDDYRSLKKADLIDYIREHGIAGMGGAGFPTDVKLHLGDDHIVNTLILNAMECEPYITADDMLIRERAEEIVSGIEIMAHLLKPHHIIIGTEDNKPQALRALEKAVRASKLDIDIISVPTVYPSGGEKQLIKLMTGIEVPSGRIPADIGIVCQNVGTAKAIHDAVHHGVPLISRVVTLTGLALQHPHNMEARIGTPFETLLGAAGVIESALYRLVMGGPMMGFTVPHDQIPLIKTTNCILAATYEEMPPAPPANPCIRCGMCEQVCPAELLPQQLHWFAKGKEFEKAKNHNLFDCIECGACSYVCPSNIPLVQYYRFAKAEIRAEEAEQRKADHARKRFEARQERLEREQAEKELRRKQRAEEAAKMQAVKQDKLQRQAEVSDTTEPDAKALKTAAAVARTKLKKAQQALKSAQEKGLEGIEALQTTVTELEQKAAAAQSALEQAENPTQPAGQPDSKQLKTAAAVARTKLKQAEKALLQAQESGEGDLAELQAKVTQLTAKAAQAQAAFEAAEAGTTPAGVDLTALKEAMDSAAAKVEKARQALVDAEANGSPAVEKMRAGVEKLEQKYQSAKSDFENANQQGQSNGADLEALKADMEQASDKVKKAEAALQTARDNGSPAAEKMAAGVDKLKGKYAEARQAWLSAGGVEAVAEANIEVDPKALKQQVSIMRTKLKKAQGAVEAAEAGEGDLDLAVSERERLTALYEDAKQAWDAYEAEQNDKAAAQGIDLKQLKIDAALARAAVTKAERALDKARETQPDDLNGMEQALLAAREKSDQLNQTLSRFTD